jgi:hypothetical protein
MAWLNMYCHNLLNKNGIGHLTNYGQKPIFRFFGHFHTEVNPEMIPNLSRRAAESLKIEFLFKIFF